VKTQRLPFAASTMSAVVEKAKDLPEIDTRTKRALYIGHEPSVEPQDTSVIKKSSKRPERLLLWHCFW